MPVALSRGDRALLGWSGLVLSLLILLTFVLAGDRANRRETPTTYSAASGGAKATYRLLATLGYDISRWEEAPDQLSDPATTTLVIAEPLQTPSLAHRSQIVAFIRAGGRVIATGPVGATFVSGFAAGDAVGGMTWSKVEATTPSAFARVAPEITLALQAHWSSEAAAIPLYGAADTPAVVRLPIGDGEAIWLASATPFTNAGAREPGNLEFVLTALGAPGDRRILWDEYVHGRRSSLGGTIVQSPVKWVFAQLGLVALLVLATHARRSGPIIVPAPESRRSPLEFVRTLGALYGRARAASIAVEVVHQRFRQALARRLGVAAGTPIEDLERLGQGPWRVEPALADTLRACEASAAAHHVDARTAFDLIHQLQTWADERELYGPTHRERHT
jgi:hypothetical protein